MYRKRILGPVLGGVLVLGTGCCIRPHPLYRSAPECREAATVPAPEPGKNVKPDPSRILPVANSYLNTPYRYGGTSRQGLDCSGLVVVVYKECLDLDLPHSSEKLYRLGRPVPKRKLRAGDLVFFGKSISAVDHVGIYLGDRQFIHASTTSGVIISSLKEKYYKRRYQGGVRIVK